LHRQKKDNFLKLGVDVLRKKAYCEHMKNQRIEDLMAELYDAHKDAHGFSPSFCGSETKEELIEMLASCQATIEDNIRERERAKAELAQKTARAFDSGFKVLPFVGIAL